MLVVIADDITGAAEIAGVCLRYGIDVGFSVDTIPLTESDVHVITTDSRSLSEEAAIAVHTSIAQQLKSHFPDATLFKKCDSALRGYVISELKALAVGESSFLVVAANPRTGRFIKNGLYYIGDELLHRTGFATDPDFPALTSDVKELVLSRSSLSDNQFRISTKLPVGNIAPGFYFPDCSSEEDLSLLAAGAGAFSFVAGSAVFFEKYIRAIGYECSVLKQTNPVVPDNFLFVPGSFHPDSRAFRLKLKQNGCRVFSFPSALLKEDEDPDAMSLVLEELKNLWKTGSKLALTISETKQNFKNSQVILKHRLSKLVTKLVFSENIQSVFVEGGATAYDIFRETGLTQFKPVAELSPGVVCLETLDSNKIRFTIKPGSYSWPENYFWPSSSTKD